MELVFLANGKAIPKPCVDALEQFENVWPGAVFHTARAAVAAVVLEQAAEEVKKLAVNIYAGDPWTEGVRDALKVLGWKPEARDEGDAGWLDD